MEVLTIASPTDQGKPISMAGRARWTNRRLSMLAAVLAVACGLGAGTAAAAVSSAAAVPSVSAPRPATATKETRRVSPFRAMGVTEKAKQQYLAFWGVEGLRVNYTMSGNLIRFSYRVADPKLAKALADRSATPYLIDVKKQIVLQVPVMDKIGPLRQSTGLKTGQEYWMAFSNKGNLVRPGDRVNVAVGVFHADNLVVE